MLVGFWRLSRKEICTCKKWFVLSMAQFLNQTPTSCEWCGKFVVSIDYPQGVRTRRLHEIYTDESGRLIKDENDSFIVGEEHRCKVVCGSCGVMVIMELGKVYDRPSFDQSKVYSPNERETLLFIAKRPHSCSKK